MSLDYLKKLSQNRDILSNLKENIKKKGTFTPEMDEKKKAGEDIRKIIGAEIKRVRKEEGLTMDQLAEKIGYGTRQSINTIESGRGNVSLSTIGLICKELNLEPVFRLNRKSYKKKE